MFVKPDNWGELTPLERRKLRLDHWQNAPVESVCYCDGLVELFEDTPGYIMTFGCSFEWTTDAKIVAYRDSVRQ